MLTRKRDRERKAVNETEAKGFGAPRDQLWVLQDPPLNGIGGVTYGDLHLSFMVEGGFWDHGGYHVCFSYFERTELLPHRLAWSD